MEKEKIESDKNNKNINNNEENKDKTNEIGKEKEDENTENPDKKKSISNTIINLTETLSKYNNNENIPNSELILIILEICLNSSQLGIEKDNSSRAFWEEIGKKPEL